MYNHLNQVGRRAYITDLKAKTQALTNEKDSGEVVLKANKTRT
jgi:hypothetical protein